MCCDGAGDGYVRFAQRPLSFLKIFAYVAKPLAPAVSGRETLQRLWLRAILYSKTPNICQDRLGTDIGKVDKKAVFFLFQGWRLPW
jgi:hypothetical protein